MEGIEYLIIFLIFTIGSFAIFTVLLYCCYIGMKRCARRKCKEDPLLVHPPQELVVDALKGNCNEESDFYVLSF
ncbi:unnamed protein product [Auanema sp. JU1783]|nr:unnamed protein product [Auanema sp. JU1783]